MAYPEIYACDLRRRFSAPWKPRESGSTAAFRFSIRILPAPVSTGIVFVRTDLDNFQIPASWRHVARVSYATSLMRQGVLISTTEHLLSVFYSMGIDNAYVEIDNLEVPILDGSGATVRPLDRGSRHPAVPPQAPLPAHSPADLGGGQRQAHQHPARRQFPPDLRHGLPAPGRTAVARNGSDAGELRQRRSPSRGPSAGNRTWTRCATWA